MSRKMEEAVGGLVQSLFGGLGSQSSLFGGGAGTVGTQPSLGFLAFLEKLQEASNLSREDERQFLEGSAEQWLAELNKPSCSCGGMTALLQRALVAASRGYIYPQLHIHAVKLTQAPKVTHKKMGYLYLSVCAEQSELSLLTTNTLHKDLQSRDALALLAALTALPSVLRCSLPPQLLHALCNCLHHPITLVRRRTCQVLFAGLTVWGQSRPAKEVKEGHAGRACDLLGGSTNSEGRSHSPLGGSSRSDYGSYDGSHRSSTDEAPRLWASRLNGDTTGESLGFDLEEKRSAATNFIQDLLVGEAVPSLLQLLSDDDPSVAIAATQTLALLYQHSDGQLEFVRNSVSCSAAHLLTAAFNATLPREYDSHRAQSQPISASHVQVAMLRGLRQLCGGSDWSVPPAVVTALTPVLTQVWGSSQPHPGVCMILQEALLLTMQLPRSATTPGLRNTAINNLLCFLKSSNCRLQLAAVTTLAQNWTVLKDCVTTALLHAVVHNLHTTTSTVISNTTLHLLYTIANERNYKTVLGTLVQYCHAASPPLLQGLLNKLARILAIHASDALWCMEQLRPLLLLHPHPTLAKALGNIISHGIQRGCHELVSPVLSLLHIVLQQTAVPRPHVVMVAMILTHLGDASVFFDTSRHVTLDAACVGQRPNASSSRSCDKYELARPDAADIPFMNDDERTLLYGANEKFLNKMLFSEVSSDDDQIIFECLKKIGLYNDGLSDRAVSIVLSFVNSANLVRRNQAREMLVWLKRGRLSMKVLRSEQEVRDSLQTLDWSLPFLEDYIVESLEKKNEMPYLPRSCSLHGDGDVDKPITKAIPQRETRVAAPVLTPRVSFSYCSTPRSVASEPRSPPLDQSSVATTSSSSSNRRTSSASGATSNRAGCDQPHGSALNPDGATSSVAWDTSGAVGSLNSLSISVSSSQHDQFRSATSGGGGCSQRGSHEGDLVLAEQRNLKHGSGARLLWSVEGRSGEVQYPGVDLPYEEDIELGAEASEELQITEDNSNHEEEVPSTAAALAKALYAGLAKK